MNHIRQGSGEGASGGGGGYGSLRSQEGGYGSSGDDLHSRNNSHDSSDYSLSGWFSGLDSFVFLFFS